MGRPMVWATCLTPSRPRRIVAEGPAASAASLASRADLASTLTRGDWASTDSSSLIASEQAQHAEELLAHLAAVNNPVDRALLQEKLRPLKSLR